MSSFVPRIQLDESVSRRQARLHLARPLVGRDEAVDETHRNEAVSLPRAGQPVVPIRIAPYSELSEERSAVELDCGLQCSEAWGMGRARVRELLEHLYVHDHLGRRAKGEVAPVRLQDRSLCTGLPK